MKWTINRKLLGGFSAVIFILILAIGLSYFQIGNVDENYSYLLEDKAQKSIDIKDLQVAVKQEVATMRAYLIIGDEQAYQDYVGATAEFQKKYDSLLSRFQIPQAIEMLQELDRIEKEYQEFAKHVFELKKQNKADEYKELVSTQGRAIVKKFDEQVAKLSKFQEDILITGNAENSAKVHNIKILELLLGIIAVLIGVIIAIFMGRLISKPITAVSQIAAKISEGDLTVEEIQVKNRDEIGDLADSFNLMAKNIRYLIEQVGISSAQVASSSEELTASAEQTTQAANQIATSIQEVATGAEMQGQGANESSLAMKEMTIGIQQVANTTSAVAEMAMETNREASNGNQTLRKVVHQMNTINEAVDDSAAVVKNLGQRSKEIEAIIEVITSIADQTNLLALNAAIESARAGEHGRGFAVVADEVRKLAEQSRASADQIAALIKNIQDETTHAVQVMNKGTQEVKVGMEVVHEAREGFKKIVQLIEQVTAQIQEASAVSEEMSASSQQVNASIEEIARIAQVSATNTQNVASASEEQMASMEEIASSALALSRLAEDLQTHVNKFKV